MAFHTIDEIRKEFDIPDDDAEEIRRELRRRLKKIHPDTNAGAGYSGDSVKHEVVRITDALGFLDAVKRRTAVVPVEEVTELVKVIKDLIPLNREKETENRFAQLIDAHIQGKKSSGRIVRVTLTAFALALTLVWLFPSITGSHPVLQKYVHVEDTVFNVIWLALLLYTGAIWGMYTLWRQRDIAAIRGLGLASTQSGLFRSFIQAHTGYHCGGIPIRFSKDEFISYLDGFGGRTFPGTSGRDVHIDAELANSLGDIILWKAESRGVIKKIDVPSLREQYMLLVAPHEL